MAQIGRMAHTVTCGRGRPLLRTAGAGRALIASAIAALLLGRPCYAQSSSENPVAAPGAAAAGTVLLVCIDEEPLWRPAAADACRWVPVSVAEAVGAESQPVAVTMPTAGKDEAAGRPIRKTPMHTKITNILAPIGEAGAFALACAIAYQARPEESYLWRLDETDPVLQTHNRELALIKPELKHQMGKERFERFGVRMSLRF